MKKITPYSYLLGKVTYVRKSDFIPKIGYKYTIDLLVEGKKRKTSSTIPVIIFEKQMVANSIQVDDYLSVKGVLVVSGSRKSPTLSVMANSIKKHEESTYKQFLKEKEENNKTVLIGYIAKFPIISRLPGKKTLYLRAALSIEKGEGRFDDVPLLCAFTEQNESSIVVGNKVCVIGRLESKNITNRKTGVVQTAYELFVTRSGRYTL